MAPAAAAVDDLLLPWLRSIHQIKQTCSEYKSKLLPYVADCFREFEDNELYRDDLRFLKVCIQYADCSPEPLRIMAKLDEKGIGHHHALFYEAYATCLEAKRRFGDANNIYKRGLSRQAQPYEKVIESYKVFRDRMDRRRKRKQDQDEQHVRKSFNMAKEDFHGTDHSNMAEDGVRQGEACKDSAELASRSHLLSSNWHTAEGLDMSFEELRLADMGIDANLQCLAMEGKFASSANSSEEQFGQVSNNMSIGSFGEETIQIRNFAAKAITGKEKDVEDARHHGLVDPTINTKEALQDILSMFREPLDIGKQKETGKSLRSQHILSLPDDSTSETNVLKGTSRNQPMEFSIFRDTGEQDRSRRKDEEAPFVVSTDKSPENNMYRGAISSQGVKESSFFVFKDDEVSKPEQQEALSVYKDDEGKPKDRLQVLDVYKDAEGKLKASLHCNISSENRDLFVFRDEEVLSGSFQRSNGIKACHEPKEKISKGKLGAKKSLARGAENMLPHSPLC